MAKIDNVSSCLIKVDGKVVAQSAAGPAGGADTGYLDTVSVDKRIDCPDAFQFELDIRIESKIILLDDMREGKPVEILMGTPGSEVPVFKGEIHYIEPHFRHGGTSTLMVSGYDKSHRLTRGTSSRTWGDGIQDADLHSSAVQDVISKAADGVAEVRDGLSAQKVESPGVQTRYIPQMNVSDYQFLKWLGHDADRKVDADTAKDDSQLMFRPIDPTRSPVKVLVREARMGEDQTQIHEARFSLSTIRQVARVEVVGWDPKRKKTIVGEADASDYTFGGTPGHKATGKGLYGSDTAGKVLRIVDRPVDSKAEADAIAKSIFNHLSMDFITGEVDFQGDPKVAAGDVVEMKEFGERFSGKYLVLEVSHSYRTKGEGFRTRCRIARNDVLKV
ncbi:MAG: hypothetical protein FJ087_10240 [Deltaproteobacteria bacterium]|nr:hypothetical protein [Deltaproteobacteria bacterium]